MSNKIKCASCGAEVTPMMVGSKSFCPECESEIVDAQPVDVPAAPAKQNTPSSESAQSGHVIKDGMGMIEENRTKIGAVETFSDNSVTTHNHTTTQPIQLIFPISLRLRMLVAE